ncbi:MAG: adenosylcobinamide-GDP ribazoletransferase [Methanimicrococcus sp.]|nr:adenosylcobinamide-GDP ribazoletransferase [Methanimicrococcus sp.]
MTLWDAFKAGFGFLSVIPVGITMEGIDALMKRLYMYPIVGFLLGLIIGAAAFILEMVLPTPLTIIAIMIATYGIVWFNHLDGIADMGDGMTAHGSLEKKRKALKDMAIGIGGVAFAGLFLLLFYSSLTTLENAAVFVINSEEIAPYILGIFGIVASSLSDLNLSAGMIDALKMASFIGLTVAVAETNGKQAMLTIATFGKPFQEGLGSMTIKGGTPTNFMIGIIFTTAVSILLLGAAGFIALIAATISAFIILNASNRHFKGLSGDGVGTSNEVGRVVAIAAIALTVLYLVGGMPWML